jgi:hypothetical protein
MLHSLLARRVSAVLPAPLWLLAATLALAVVLVAALWISKRARSSRTPPRRRRRLVPTEVSLVLPEVTKTFLQAWLNMVSRRL